MQQNHPPGRLTYNYNIVLYADNPVSGRTLGPLAGYGHLVWYHRVVACAEKPLEPRFKSADALASDGDLVTV